jgi:hypothetical protein
MKLYMNNIKVKKKKILNLFRKWEITNQPFNMFNVYFIITFKMLQN